MGTKHRDFGTLNGATEGAAGDRTSDLHAPGFIDSTDPASTYGTSDSTKPPGVQAGQLWIQESSADTFDTLKYRNSSNDGWIEVDLDVSYDDDEKLQFGTGDDYWLVYNSTGTQFELWTTDNDGGGSDGLIFDVADGADVLDFTTTPTVGGTNVVLETRTLTAGTGLTGGGDLSANRTFNVSGLTDSEIASGAEIAVAKLADGTARQLLQTDAAGTGVEWASNIDVPGTLDVTGAGTFDSTVTSVGACTWDTGANGSSFGGTLYINETANANMTTGLTINQGANNDEILALKSSDVAHGMTDFTETDTFGFLSKAVAADGGVKLSGYTSRDSFAFTIRGHTTGEDTAKSTSASGVVNIDGFKSDGGTGRTGLGTDGNILVVRDGGTTRFIFDVEGSGHSDVEWTTYDQFDDLAVMDQMDALLAPRDHDAAQNVFGAAMEYDRSWFEDEGFVHDVREVGDGRMRGMVNWTKVQMLHHGAIRQVGSETRGLRAALREIVDQNPNLQGRDRALALLN